MNIAPTLEQKRDIVQNVIDLAHVLGIATPNVAILSAIETVNPRIRSSVEAAALRKMADRGQISGGVVDGPLAFDTAVSETAATTQGISSPVADKTDILVAPDLETGTLLAKQLEYLAEAQATGIVLGARVPIALIGSADNLLIVSAAYARPRATCAASSAWSRPARAARISSTRCLPCAARSTRSTGSDAPSS